jgi:hypothetical protein
MKFEHHADPRGWDPVDERENVQEQRCHHIYWRLVELGKGVNGICDTGGESGNAAKVILKGR